MNLDKFIELLFEKAKEKGLKEYEVYYSTGDDFSVNIFGGEIDRYKTSSSGGLSFRAIVDGKMGYSFTEILDEGSIDILINEVIENGKVIESEDEQFIFSGSKEYKKINMINPKFDEVTSAQKIEFAKKLEEYAKSLDPRVDAVNYCVFGSGYGKRVIVNSKGLKLEDEGNVGYSYVSVVVKDGEERRSDWDYIVSNRWEEYDYKKIAKDAVNKAISQLGGSPVPSGAYKTLIKNSTFADFLGAMMGIFSAESVQKGTSLLKGKIGEVIAIPEFNLIDDPHMENGFASKGFDDEGVATYRKHLIQNGELKTFLYNLKTAKKDGVESTGNAKKGGYKGSVEIAPSNIYVEAGKKSYDDIISSLDQGMIITALNGLHSGLNSISGDFSLAADGFLVENGKITKAVNQITVAGNFFELIKNIETIGSDLKFNLSEVGSPSILVKELSISGE